MPRFRKKLIEIEAIQFKKDRSNIDEVRNFLFGAMWYTKDNDFIIHTLEGDNLVKPGDWIIKFAGEFHSCRPDVFDLTYELIDERIPFRY